MFHFSPRVFLMLALATAFPLIAKGQRQAQVSSVSVSTTPRTNNPARSANAGWHDTMPDRLISAQVHDGVLAIDGMVAKVQLNYEIQRAGYMYFFVPGIGTAVVSLAPIDDAERVTNAINGPKLSFVAGGHTFELCNNKGNFLTKDRSKTDVWVRLDRSTVAVGRYPRMGFGNSDESPYVWPLSGPADRDRDAHLVAPPPLPASVLPETENTASAMMPVGRNR
jgi:hypothetical protein